MTSSWSFIFKYVYVSVCVGGGALLKYIAKLQILVKSDKNIRQFKENLPPLMTIACLVTNAVVVSVDSNA